jgi:uncharacterized protein YeeX (DUF496 family)
MEWRMIMDPSIRANRSRVNFLVIAGILVWPGVVCAQQAKSVERAVNQKQITSVPTDSTMAPVRKTDWVRTDDPIALLAGGDTEDFKGAPLRGGSTLPETAKASAESAPMRGEAAKKNEEIAAIEKQIVEKQKRIVLLMRLFVNDEPAFLIDPTNKDVETAVRERRKYEQDELLFESAEIARLRAKAETLKASGEIAKAPALR